MPTMLSQYGILINPMATKIQYGLAKAGFWGWQREGEFDLGRPKWIRFSRCLNNYLKTTTSQILRV